MRSNRRNNIIAGSFLLLCLVLAVAISLVLSDVGDRFIPKNSYIVRFDLAEGASGILPGSVVEIGGRSTGHVTRIDFAFEDPSRPGVPTGIDVTFVMPRDITLFEDAVVTLSRPLIGSMSAINIIDLGDGTRVASIQGSSPLLEPGELLQGTLAPPSFLAQAGFGPDQADAVREVIRRIKDVVTRFDDMSLDLDTRLGPLLDQLDASFADIRTIINDVSEREPGWSDDIDATLATARTAASEAQQAIEDFRTGVEGANKLIDGAQSTLDDNRPQIDRIVDNVESATDRFQTDTLDQLDRSLAQFEQGSARFAKVGAQANDLLVEQAPEIRRTLANMRLASDQLKLATVEIRRNPWRLLYRPDAKTTKSEIIYDAARAYASAVSDLRAASASLEAAASLSAPDPAQLTTLRNRVSEALDRFETTQQELLNMLLQQ